jgi:antitoxin (DNA-binding transcriptional repressor) of toxin-antitoxin stability system
LAGQVGSWVARTLPGTAVTIAARSGEESIGGMVARLRVAQVLHFDREWPDHTARASQRHGRNMRALDKGKAFVVTRIGVPVGELVPLRQRVFVSAEAVLAAFTGAPRVASRRFRKDVDAVIDQDSTHRG